MQKLVSFFPLVLFSFAAAQLPDTEVWLFKIKTDKMAINTLVNAQNITNRPGYDNQPAFSPDGKKIYYVSIREDRQADIYFYDLNKKKSFQLTHSTESEYSPVVTENKKFITSVMVEKDSSQRVHFLDAETGNDSKKLKFDSVGYYMSLNNDTILYYKLTNPHSLRFFVSSTNEDRWIADSPARTFRRVNRNSFIYGIKDSLKVSVYRYNFVIQKGEKLADCPGVNEDMIWHASWGLIISDGSRLLRYDETKKEWKLLFELSLFGIKKITRFCFDPKNKNLVVVNNL